jgi:hypothetical protein
MRPAIVLADVLTAPGGGVQLARLASAGLSPVVLTVASPPEAVPADAHGFPVVASPLASPACWDDAVDLLGTATARCGATAPEAFVLCGDAAAVTRAASSGARPVLVLAGRSLEDVFGAVEPPAKHIPVAPDLATAVGYVIEEAGQDAAVGLFPYAATTPIDARAAAPIATPRDLALFFGLMTVAAIAIALGIAYLLQEVYQTVTFPPIAYWVTLQFIPQTWRGLLFLGAGTFIGLAARPLLARLLRRRPGRV